MHAERVPGTSANGDLNKKQVYFMPQEVPGREPTTSVVVRTPSGSWLHST